MSEIQKNPENKTVDTRPLCLSGKGVTKVFGFGETWTVAVDHVDFAFHEGEIISTIAIAVSSIVTTLIILVGVIAIVPLTPVLESPVLEPAFNMILPALFGGLAVVFVSKNLKLSIAPIVLMLALMDS